MKKIVLAFGILINFITCSFAQAVEISSITTPTMTVCGQAESYQVKVKNNTANGLSNLTVNVQLPTGVEYVGNSLMELSAYNVQEQNVSNSAALAFSANNLPAGDSLEFVIETTANIDAIAYQQQGNVFRNVVTANYTGGPASHTSNAYNVLYAALSIINVSPSSQTAITGELVTRNITIVNAGNGKLSEFQLTDIRNNAGVDLVSTNLGILNGSLDTITLTAADFSTIGNNDGYFNTNESITITQTLSASGCAANTVTSTIHTLWGCEGDTRTSNNSYAHVTVNLKNPNLSVASTESLSSCFASQSSPQELELTNNGAGYATNVAVDIYKSSGNGYDQDLFSAIDATTITYQVGVNGAPVGISPTTHATRNDLKYSCLGSSPIGRVTFVLPVDIAPGELVIIKWNSYHCCISECDNENLMGWKYEVDYQDPCGNNNYSKTGTGEDVTELNMTVFVETPIDIDAGETLPFVYTISSHDNNLPVGTDAQYEVLLTLPLGLTWGGGANDFVWTSSPNSWLPLAVNFDTNTRELSGIFLVPEPFNIQKSEILFNLTGDCSGGVTSGTQNLSFDINYLPDATCSSCKVNMICDELTTTNLHCPILNCDGFNFLSFDAQRINYGNADNDANGLADANDVLDFNKIKTNRVMVGDTLQTTYKVVVDTGANNSYFVNFFVEADIDYGQNLTAIGGTISIYDGTTNTTYTCTNFRTDIVDGANDQRKFRYTFLPNFDCTGLPNTPGAGNQFYFTDGDSITFVANYAVTGNIGGNVEQVTINNDLFSSSLAAPWGADASLLSNDKWACNDYDGRFTLIGYYFQNSAAKNYTLSSCEKIVEQNFSFSVGDCCDNYGGGNLFPYEYRNWAHIKEVTISIPTDYQVVDVYFKQYRTRTTNQTSTQTVNNLVPYHNSGGVMKFNLEQHYQAFGGNVIYSDDGFHGTVYLQLAPTCNVPINTYEDVNWEFKFAKTAYLGGGETGWLTASPDRIRYKPTDLVLTSNNPVVDGLGRTVSWNLNVKNNTNNSSTANSWIHIKTPSNEVKILQVIDNSNGDTLQLTSDYYAIGNINKNSIKSYTIVGKYEACAPDYIVAYAGYECSGYPIDFAHFYCSYSTLGLNVEPKNAEPQVTIAGTTIGNECSNTIEVTVEVASVKFAHLDSIEVDITAVGNSMTFVNNSGELKYPLSGAFSSISDPLATISGNTYQLMNMNSTLNQNGLPGVLDLNNNRFQLKFRMNLENNFKTGDFVQLTIKSKEICGTTLPVINLAYDPSVQFSQNTLAGLSNDASDSWGIAWGDYDNDGFDDLYVAEYDQAKGSYLYHNNGDGSFTKETSGVITTDGGSSIAGTWGDYNNDGFLDLFVANNTGALNALYKNDGGGSFTKITKGAIANYGGYCHGASWVDYNNDGNLDLFVTDYMPTKFNLLYKNNGDETFTLITNSALVQEAKYSIGATWADYDNDGDMDVFVPATNGESNSLYRNDGAEVFVKMTTIGIAADNANSVGCSWGDYDNDGDLDLFITNTSNQNNFFYENNGDGTFINITSGILVNDGGHSSSSNWVDFDNDGDLDLYVCNDQADQNTMYINNGDKTFSKPATPLSENLGNSYSQAWSDFDNDGDLDVLIGNHSNENNVFFENSRANCNSWLCLKLTGVNANRSAIGARIHVKANIYGQDVWQLKEISAQTGGGAGSQNSLKTLFGLGDASTVDSIIVEWPSGYRQEMTNQTINDCMDLVEGDGVQVCGTVYNDINQNCVQDDGEAGIPGILVKAMPDNRYATTDANGNYQFFLEPGTYTISQQVPVNWTATCSFPSGGYDLTLADGQTYCGNSFGNTTTCADANLLVTLGTTALRKGFQNEYSIVYGNAGAYDSYNVALSIEFDEAIVPLSASTSWSSVVVNDSSSTYTWMIDTVKAMTYYNINLIDSVSVSSTIGQELIVIANITDNLNDCDISDNVYTDVNPIVGAVDPNDLTVYPSGDGYQGYIDKQQELRYKIRFQNVGTYFAQNVVVSDVLPEELDINSIRSVLSDHDYKMTIDGRKITFTFRNIYLPDSSQDEEGSNGFVEFRIMPVEGIEHGAIIPNKALIVFDYEEPLATNRVHNTIRLSSEGVQNKVIVHPNPVEDQTTILLELSQDKYAKYIPIANIQLFDVLGTQIKNKVYKEFPHEVILDCNDLNQGTYLVKVIDQLGREYAGKLIKK